MLGQFSGPICGESVANNVSYDYLNRKRLSVQKMDTALITDVSDVGVFRFKKLYKMFSLYARFIIFLRGVDVVYVTPGQTKLGLYRFLPFLLVAKLFGVRLVSHWHGYGIYFLAKDHSIWLVNFVLGLSNVNIFLTQDIKNKLKRLLSDTFSATVVRNFVELYENLDKSESTGSDVKLKVLYLGSLTKEKGADKFINAAKLVEECDFILCGQGESEIELEAKILHASSDNFWSHGVVVGRKKAEIFKQADIFVLQTAYKTEGVPLSMLEAMASECAIVTTAHNGIPETVVDGALFVQPDSLEDLVSALQALVRDPDLLKSLKASSKKRAKLHTLDKYLVELFLVLTGPVVVK